MRPGATKNATPGSEESTNRRGKGPQGETVRGGKKAR